MMRKERKDVISVSLTKATVDLLDNTSYRERESRSSLVERCVLEAIGEMEAMA